MQVKDAVKKLAAANWRQKLTTLASIFIVYVVMLTGIFSYFHSEDSVSNRLNSSGGSITLREPQWDSEGQKMACASEPGMEIPKDPYAYNDGQVDEYVRLKLTVKFTDYAGRLSAEDIPSNDSRAQSILEALRLVSKTKAANGTETTTATPFMEKTGTGWECKNSSFIMVEAAANPSQEDISGKTYYMYDYYFYFVDSSSDMQAVKPGECTSELFQRIDIPIFKKDYLGVFDQEYTISIKAEGIPAGGERYPSGLAAVAAPAAFDAEQ